MKRLLCALSVAGLLASAPDALAAKPKGDKVEKLFKKLEPLNYGMAQKLQRLLQLTNPVGPSTRRRP